jgi:ketosteroid isomerase-like protein
MAGAVDRRDRIIHRGFARSYEAWSRRDWEVNTLLVSPHEYVFRAADLHEMLPDIDEEFKGVEGYLQAQDLLTEAWSPIRVELTEVVFADRERVAVIARWSGRGARSGTPFEQNGLLDNVFRDGLAVEQTYWWSAARGAETLGLPLPGTRR